MITCSKHKLKKVNFVLCRVFKETLIPTLGPFALNNLVSKDEFFNLTKNVIYAVDTHSNDEGIR